MNSLAVKRDTREAAKGAKPNRQEKQLATQLPMSLRAPSPGAAGVVRIQRKGACTCGGGCPGCQEETLFQAKLKVNQPGDVYEREADHLADEVMGHSHVAASTAHSLAPSDALLQRGGAVATSAWGSYDATAIVSEVVRRPGQPLDYDTRSFMEAGFGRDFSHVRVHTNEEAAESARAVSALAYTVGSHVVFGDGQYEPGTAVGRRLLAHELSHTIQQTRSAPARASGMSLMRASGLADAQNRDTGSQAAGIQSQGQPGVAGLQRPVVTTHIPTDLDPQCVVVIGSIPLSTFEIFFGQDSAVVPAAQLTAVIDPFVASWRAGGGRGSVNVDASASTDGPSEEYNWHLSCRRAKAVADVLVTRGRIPSTMVKSLAHGPTRQFSPYDKNRRANIHIVSRTSPTPPTAPTAPTAPAGGITITQCPADPHLIGSRSSSVGCGAGPDFTFNDFPSLSFAHNAAMLAFRAESDAFLEAEFRAELASLTPSARTIGQAMITRFISGSSATFVHGVGSTLSALVARSPAFLSALMTVMSSLQGQIRAQASRNAIDCRLFSVPAPAISSHWGELTLKALIGGTQGLDVFITGFSALPARRTYSATLRFTMCDDFGVDENDLYSPGLFAFWELQHERSGHRPFINEITVDVPISGVF